MSRNKFLIFLSVLLLLGLYACHSSPDQEAIQEALDHPALIDWTQSEGSECNSACWYGFEPGMTSYEEVLAGVQSLPFINPVPVSDQEFRIGDSPVFRRSTQFRCKNPPDFECLGFYFENGVVRQIGISTVHPIPLQQFVSKFGPPTGFKVYRENVETKGCILSLYWSGRHMNVHYFEGRRRFGKDLCEIIWRADGKVPADIPVHGITFFEQNQFEAMLSAPSPYLQTWNGFLGDD